MMSWLGDQSEATYIVDELVKNAVEHAGQRPSKEIVLALTVAEDETLLIAVTDSRPDFPAFQEAISAQKATGLPRVRELGGETTWRPADDRAEKTVQVLVRYPSPAADTH
ncbi:ATP-binding protein [Streptomyces sp. NPDC060006]|uniref:ATP-binding protein n=1 Tax=unclassified Streptomyces TaxID=2593676 RepID=UPI0036A30FDD